VRASTSSGYAIPLIREPIVETTCPVHRRRKSRLRQRGMSVDSF
jgi:hypothetical protein